MSNEATGLQYPDSRELERVLETEELHPSDLAKHFYEYSTEDSLRVLRQLPIDLAAQALIESEEDLAGNLISFCSDEEVGHWLETLPSDDATYLLNLLDDSRSQSVLQRLSLGHKEDVSEILRYEDDEVGSIMQIEVLRLSIDMSAEGAIRKFRREWTENFGDSYTAYVVNEKGALLGRLPLVDLLKCSGRTLVGDRMEPCPITVNPHDDKEKVAHLALEYDEISLPIVSGEGIFLGVATIDDLGEVLVDEYKEDIGLMSGTGDELVARRGVLYSAKERFPWLLLGLAGGLTTAQIMGLFTGAIQNNPIVVFFVPLVASMGGNVGIQSSSIVVRGLATGEIDRKKLPRRLWREVRIALLNGILCSTFIVLFCTVVLGHIDAAIFVPISMFLVMMLSAFVGTTVPFLLHTMKLDPAYSTGPFITVGNDILGVAIYLNIAQLYFSLAGVA